MDKYADILEAVNHDAWDIVESLQSVEKHRREIKVTFQLNLIDLIGKLTNKYFFKLYILENEQWKFFDYGWLNDGVFHTFKSKLLVFNIPNFEFRVIRHDSSLNHILVANDGILYLMYSPYPEVIDIFFNRIHYQ